MLLLGAAIGRVNGVLVNRLRLHPLILTFGMLSILQGTIFTFTDRSVGRASAHAAVARQRRHRSACRSRPAAARSCWPSCRSCFFATRASAIIWSPSAATRKARGAPASTSAASGSRCFVLSGVGAALAGLLLAGRLGTGYPLAGAGLELDCHRRRGARRHSARGRPRQRRRARVGGVSCSASSPTSSICSRSPPSCRCSSRD